MNLFSYVVRYDFGFAPNPFHGWCSLATCKQDFRARVETGDWVVGTGSKQNDREGTLVYAMQVDEILTFEEYWEDDRFRAKRPIRRGSYRQRYGDNIYHRDADGRWIQENSRHSLDDGTPNQGHIERDTSANAVLLSQHFVYYGGEGPTIPPRFRNWEGPTWTGSRWDPDTPKRHDICAGRGFKRHFPRDMRDGFIEWIGALPETGYSGEPANW